MCFTFFKKDAATKAAEKLAAAKATQEAAAKAAQEAAAKAYDEELAAAKATQEAAAKAAEEAAAKATQEAAAKAAEEAAAKAYDEEYIKNYKDTYIAGLLYNKYRAEAVNLQIPNITQMAMKQLCHHYQMKQLMAQPMAQFITKHIDDTKETDRRVRELIRLGKLKSERGSS